MTTVTAKRIALRERSWWKSLLSPSKLLEAAVILLVAWLSLGPLVLLVWATIWDGERLSIDALGDAYSSSSVMVLLWPTLIFAIGTAVLAVGTGVSLAYMSARTNIPFKGLVVAASLVPLIIPQVLYTIAWIYLGSPRVGLINAWLEPLLGKGFFDVFSMGGMILVEGLHLTPLVYLLMYASFKSIDPSFEESAQMCGASRLTAVRRVTIPLAAPAVYASILIMFIRGLESFEVPALLGLPSNIVVFMSRIWKAVDNFPPDYATAGAYSLGLIAITGVGVYWYSRLTSARGKSFQTVTGKGFRPHGMDLGRWRWPLAGLVVVYFVVAVVLPVFVLVYGSVQKYYKVPTWKTLTHPTLVNYIDMFQRDSTWQAMQNSLILAVSTATAVMLVMAIASWIVVRTKRRGRWLIDLLSFIPLGIPGLVLGVAILIIYIRVPIPIYATMWIMFISYFTRFMPYGMRYVSTSMHQIGVELEEAAQTSGAGWFQIFRRVILPLVMPGMIAGWVYILCVSIRELSASLLLYSPGNQVLSIEIWQLWENGNFPGVASIGILMIFVLVTVIFLAQNVVKRYGIREM